MENSSNKIIVKVDDKDIEIEYTLDEEIEINFIEEDLEKTLDLTEQLNNLEDTLILDGDLNDE